MDGKKLPFIAAMVGIAIVLIIVMWIIAIIGAMDLTDGCLYRYNIQDDGSISNASRVTNTVTLKANANYTALDSQLTDSSRVAIDPSGYGKWLNTNLRLSAGQKIKFVIKGDVSLCKAYLPINNLQSLSNENAQGKLIPIPRIDDKISPPATLYFEAKSDKWRNLAEVFQNDKILVSLGPDQKTEEPVTMVYNSIKNKDISADCREGKRSYSPICGRYSIWDRYTPYVSSCKFVPECYDCHCRDECENWDIWGWCVFGKTYVCDKCSCYTDNKSIAPEPYANSGKYTAPWSDNFSVLMPDFAKSCRQYHGYINGEYQNKKYFWFSADNAAGLLYRFDNNIYPTNPSNRGENYKFAKIQKNHESELENLSEIHKQKLSEEQKKQLSSIEEENNRIILNTTYTGNDVGYLQYRFIDNDGKFANNTGGYVFNIRQTKCRRSNGNGLNDTIQGRGVVQYVIANYGLNPNSSENNQVNNIIVDENGSGEIEVSQNSEGYLWLKIYNDEKDYKDSFGQYEVQFLTNMKSSSFYNDVLDPFFEGLKSKIKNASVTIFKNMTCYKTAGSDDSCTNFFQYIKFILILYIMLYGMMFLLGMVRISQTDLVIRIIKISLVAGLMDGSTFEFFNTYVFDTVTGFSDDIISNMAGYSAFSGNNSISNPFMFLDDVMTKIFLSSTFAAQIMALLSMGLNGVLYFILVVVCIGIIIIVAFRAIAVYLMAFMAIAVLIGLAPLFLTFILFDRTWYLFDNWVKFMIRYMIEPVIMLAGIIILTQLFTIYLDYVIGYSVCWKCAIPIKIPFPTIEGVTPAFLDIELFCLNWFAPWGFDHRSSQMGLNMQNMVVLLMLAYCMWGYIDFSNKIVARLAGGSGGPSATSMGNRMSGGLMDKALSRIGLDKASRSEISHYAAARSKSIKRGDRVNPLSIADRKDMPASDDQDGNRDDSGIQQSSTGTGQTSNSNVASNSQNDNAANISDSSSNDQDDSSADNSTEDNRRSSVPRPGIKETKDNKPKKK